MIELTQRLLHLSEGGPGDVNTACREAADMIIGLNGEVERLQAEVVQWKREAGKYSAGCELCAAREAEIERRQADQQDAAHLAAENFERAKRAEAENERLRERLGPRGLEVVEINGAGHYVNERVKAEIDRLRAALAQIHAFASVMDESNWRDLRLHIERQCSARGAFEPAENERLRAALKVIADPNNVRLDAGARSVAHELQKVALAALEQKAAEK